MPLDEVNQIFQQMIESRQIKFKPANGGKRIYTCEGCKLVIKNDSDMLIHIKTAHTSEYICKKCGEKNYQVNYEVHKYLCDNAMLK